MKPRRTMLLEVHLLWPSADGHLDANIKIKDEVRIPQKLLGDRKALALIASKMLTNMADSVISNPRLFACEGSTTISHKRMSVRMKAKVSR